MKYIDTIASDVNDLAFELTLMQTKRLVENFGRGGHYNLNFSIPPIVTHGGDDSNIEYNVIYNYGLNAFSYSSTGAPLFDAKLTMHHVKAKLTIPDGGRVAVIRLKERCDNKNGVQDFGDQIYTDHWLFISNTPAVAYTQPSPVNSLGFDYRFDTSDGSQLYRRDVTGGFTPYGGTSGTNALFNQTGTSLVFNSFDDNNKANLKILGDRLITALHAFSVSRWAVNVPISNACVSCSEFGGGYASWVLPTVIPNAIPIYDARSEDDVSWIDNVYDYIVNGNRHGDVDPFIPPYPEATEIEDYKTSQKLYISQNSKTNNKYSFEFLNADYNKLDQINRDQYACYVYYNHLNDVKKTSQPAPVVTVNEDITTSTDDYIAVSYLGWVDQTAEDAQTSGAFKVWYKYRKDSNVGIVVDRVEWLEHPWEAGGRVCSRTILESGEQVYTSPISGETMTIIYRAINMDDIKADFTDDDDNEDDATGTDVTIPTGRGIGTYLISEAQLTAINAKLWSYDWAQFFKSSTINPVQCVISCKSIPFAAEAAGSEQIVIANMFTDVNASRVNPSFRSGTGATLSVTMPSYNGDFTDIEHVRVHCYLPYIGWVDLPASEVISRRAKLDVGLSANTKILTFRYLADLIDGTCTCIIAVNGTERWKFDGVCGVDIPVTSDNHTNAINNAMHAGLQTALSLGSAVVGGLTGNGMMSAGGIVSAISNVPNAIPTYSYSSSASPSGYINAAMNSHIMLVIERPNVKYDANTVRRLGKPCHKVLPLGSLRGFTKCGAVRLEGIDATPEELALIAAGLERGVIL